MDEKMTREDQREKVYSKDKSSAGGSAARSLPATVRRSAGPPAGGTRGVAAGEGDKTNRRADGSVRPETSSDAETLPRGTRAPAVFRQITVGKPAPSSPPAHKSEAAPLSANAGGKDSAKRDAAKKDGAEKDTTPDAADSPDATRLLSKEQLARAFSPAVKEKGDAISSSDTHAPQSEPNPGSSAESSQPELRGTLPRVAGDDESTQFFQLSVPERGPIRGEPIPHTENEAAAGDSARGTGDDSPNRVISRPISAAPAGAGNETRTEAGNETGDKAEIDEGPTAFRAVPQEAMRTKRPASPPTAAEVYARSAAENAAGAVREPASAPAAAPPATQGKLHALVPWLALVNLGLTLLALAAEAYIIVHLVSAGR